LSKIAAIVAKEIREAVPAFVVFLFLFHMIALTKAVSLDDYSITALRATASTIGALIVAKAILLVEALPIGRLFSSRLMIQVVWKTLLFGAVALLFRFIEEIIPLISKHGGLAAGVKAMFEEISWPLFGVLALWLVGGLFLYCLASELVHMVGAQKIKQMLLGTSDGVSQG
jgi:hypothetical protein